MADGPKSLDTFATQDIVPGAGFVRSPPPGTTGGALVLDPQTPQPVGPSSVVGTSTKASHGDHVHQGVHSISVDGGPQQFGDVSLTTPSVSVKGIILLPLVEADIDPALTLGIINPAANFELPSIQWDALGNFHKARWDTALRDDVAAVNNQKLVIVTVETVAENAKNWKLDIYTGSAGNGDLLSAFTYSGPTTVTINSTNGSYAEHITTVNLSDAAFADNKMYFVKLIGNSQTAVNALQLIALYITYDKD